MKHVGQTGSQGRAAVTAVRVDPVEVSGLCDEGLRARLGEIGRAESALTAMKAAALGEMNHTGLRRDSGC